jgi:cytidylate kinase
VEVIAIDGPGGSGKSTLAAALARRLGLPHLDTGAMYRAVALAALRRGVDLDDGTALAELAQGLDLAVDGSRVVVDGEDVSLAIRTPEVSAAASAVATHPEVRAELVRRQRAWVFARGGGVVEGRDIGTVVFPDAPLKAYVTADEAERARRRAADAGAADERAVAEELSRRDALDASRAASPLQVAEGAVVIDTTGRPVDDLVEQLVALARGRRRR